MNLYVNNYAPDADKVEITFPQHKVVIERDENGEVHITIFNGVYHSEERIVLGKEGSTLKV